MAQATKEQIQKLEEEHKKQFYNLVMANNYYLWLGKQFASMSPAQQKAVQNYANVFARLTQIWKQRQKTLEKAGVPKFEPHFGNPAYQVQLNAMLKDMLKPIQGIVTNPATGQNAATGISGRIGIAPIIIPLIWGISAIAALFTANQIVDELNNTAQERAELVSATSNSCKDLGITPEQCAQLITTTQPSDTTSEITSLLKWGIFGFLAFKGIEMATKK